MQKYSRSWVYFSCFDCKLGLMEKELLSQTLWPIQMALNLCSKVEHVDENKTTRAKNDNQLITELSTQFYVSGVIAICKF